MKGLHEVVHRDEQAQGVMGLRHRKLYPGSRGLFLLIIPKGRGKINLWNQGTKIEERLGDLVPFLAKFVCFLQIVVFRQFGGLFSPFF
jgi:hypothetical protein